MKGILRAISCIVGPVTGFRGRNTLPYKLHKNISLSLKMNTYIPFAM